MAGETNLETLKKNKEAVFGGASPLNGNMDHSMLEKSATNRLVISGYQAQLELSLRGTHEAMLAWENMNLETGKHKNFREIEDPVTKNKTTQPVWIDNNQDVAREVGHVENAQLVCGGYSRQQFLGQIEAQSANIAGAEPPKRWWQKLLGTK